MPSMNYDGYILIGIGVALSIVSFFMKRLKEEVDKTKSKLTRIEINQARNHERLANIDKLLEDRRQDIKKLFEKK
jgi:hypothetical protein